MSDEDDFSNLPTIVIKVNISCCNACPKKLSKLLSKTDGVAWFEINEEEGLVEIKGDADPQALVRKIAKSLHKKKTQLVHFELPKEKSPPPPEPKKEEDTTSSKGKSPSEHVSDDDVAPHTHYYNPPYHHGPPPPPHYVYGPPAPPPPPHYSNCASKYFNDENTSGCEIM